MEELNPQTCACGGINLDRFIQPVILAILAEQPGSGYSVVKRIPHYATFRLGGADPAGVYRYLKLLQKKGLIEQAPPTEQQPTALPYHITTAGRHCLALWKDTLADYVMQIQQLLEQIPASATEGR